MHVRQKLETAGVLTDEAPPSQENLPEAQIDEQKPHYIAYVKGLKNVIGSSSFDYASRLTYVATYAKKELQVNQVISFQKDTFETEKNKFVELCEGGEDCVSYVEAEVEDYQPPTIEAINSMITALAIDQTDDKTTLMHCSAGCGRTGFMVAILMSVIHGIHIETAIRRRRGFPHARAN